MKKKIEDNKIQEFEEIKGEKISRKEAIKKVGYFAISASTMMILLGSPQKAHAASPDPPPNL